MADGTDAVVVEAEGTSQESSTETETSTAQETEQETSGDAQAGKDGKTSQETASTDESKDDDPKPDKDNRVSLHAEHFNRLKRQRSEYKSTLDEFKELGIESKEHAEFLRRGADDFAFVIDQIENRPEEFFQKLREEFPDQYKSHMGSVGTQATSGFLKTYADSYRRRGEKGDSDTADMLDSLAELARDGGKPKTELARTGKEGDDGRKTLQEDRYNFFAEQVTLETQAALTGKINELTKGVEFRTERQRAKFMDSVVGDVEEELEKNPIYVRERNEEQHPRHGLGRNHRKDVVNLYVRNATAGDRLERAVEDNLSHMNLSRSTGGGKQDGKRQNDGRREVSSSGTPSAGKVTQEATDRIKQEIANEGLGGADAMKEYMKRKAKLRGQ